MKLFWDVLAFRLKFVILGPLDELPDIFCGCVVFFFFFFFSLSGSKLLLMKEQKVTFFKTLFKR